MTLSDTEALLFRLTGPEAALPDSATVGGKARGLAWLSGLGLRVPDAVVIVPGDGELPDAVLEAALSAVGGGPWAVRSSASDEDGDQSSFAGQYLSGLELDTLAAVRDGFARCVDSLQSARAAAYRTEQGGSRPARMAVVVQKMVRAATAGVLFTLDPVSGRRDHLIIDAVEGLGESLVSGHATPDHVVLGPGGDVRVLEPAGSTPLLDPEQLAHLVREARAAERAHGGPLDLEWAIDADGVVWWLQARPITRVPPDPRSRDTTTHAPTDVHTRFNIGEMMPGAVTPLTQDLTGRGIDHGLQDMMIRCGAQSGHEDQLVYLSAFFGHLFLNLTALARICTAVAGSTTERMGQALCGRPIPEVDPGPSRNPVTQAVNGLRYGIYLLGAGRAQRALSREIERAAPIPDGGASALIPWLETEVERLFRAYALHIQSSATSGASPAVSARRGSARWSRSWGSPP